MPFGLYATPGYGRASQVRVKNGLLAEYGGDGLGIVIRRTSGPAPTPQPAPASAKVPFFFGFKSAPRPATPAPFSIGFKFKTVPQSQPVAPVSPFAAKKINSLLAEYNGCGFSGLGRSGFITYSVPGGKIQNEIEDRIYRGILAQKGMTKADAWSAVLAWRQSGYGAKDVLLPPAPAPTPWMRPSKQATIQAMPRIAPSVIQMAPPVQAPAPTPSPAPAAPAAVLDFVVETLPAPYQPAATVQTAPVQEAPATAIQTVAAQPSTWESYSAAPAMQTAPMQAEIQPQGVQTAQLPASGGNGTVTVPAAGNVMTTPVAEQPKSSFWGLATLATLATIMAGGASTWKSLKH